MIEKILSFLVFILFLTTCNSSLFAQCNSIANNSCTSAAPIIIGNNVTCTTLPNQGGRRNFRVTNMIANATYRISNCGSGIDTQMTIRDLANTVVGYNDDNGPACAGTSASIDFIPPVTGDYRIQLNWFGFGGCETTPNTSNGDIVVTLLANAPTPPVNNNCGNATALTVNPTTACTTTTIGTTVGATQSIGAINCNGFTGNADDDVWYNFVATANNHDIIVTPGTLDDAVVDLRSGSCNGTNIDCADATVGTNPETINATGLTIGATYYVRVYSYDNNSDQGTFDICITTPGICTPTTETPDTLYISEVSFLGTLLDTSNTSTFTNGYQDFTALTPKSRQVEGEGINIFVETSPAFGSGGRIKAWVDWNKDGVFNTLNEEVYDSGNTSTPTTTFGFVIPNNFSATAENYRLRVRTSIGVDYLFSTIFNYDHGPCEDFLDDGFFTEIFGEAEDYEFTVEPYCNAIITTVTDGETCGTGTVSLSVTASGSPSEFRWYNNETGGSLVATTPTGNWTTPSISTTTTYYVTAFNGCESWQRIPVVANFNPIPTLSVTPNASNRIVCGENDVLEISANGDIDDTFLIDEDFEAGNLGVFSNVTLTGNTANGTANWQNETSTFIPSEQVWFPAIASGFGTNQFATSNSDIGPFVTHKALQSTNSYNTQNFTNLTLSFRTYYSHFLADGTDTVDDNVAVEVSTDGTNWTSVTADVISPVLVLDVPGGNIVGDLGIGTRFETLSFNLLTYINQPTLSIRIRFFAGWKDGIAVDDIKLFGDKDITTVTWTTTPVGIIDLFEDALGATPYTGNSLATVYAIPNLTQLEQGSYSFTINAMLSNGCGNASFPFNITNNTKVWKGISSSDWNLANNWRPSGIPTSDKCVIISDIGAGTDSFIKGPPLPPSPAFAKNVTIKNGAIIELESETSLTITDWLNVETTGLFYMKNNSSLIQVNNVGNTGDIFVERAPANGGAVGNLNYVYWSSPVKIFSVDNISPNSGTGLKWEWEPTTASIYGNWSDASSNTMVDGQGYIVRGLSGVVANPSVTLTANSTLFDGVPNNGDISTPILRGNYNVAGNPGYSGFNGVTAFNEDDNWNLIGNPYPSAIWADSFIERNVANSIPNNNYGNFGLTPNQKIIGSIWLWPHTGIPSAANSDPFYDDFGSNYGAQYIAYNFMGSTTDTFKGFIASGQAFFVLADHNNTVQSGDNVLFHNGMRDATFSNNNFLRSENNNITTDLSRHRIWLNLVDSENKAQAILIGYAENATNEQDNLYDAPQFTGASFSFYSLIDSNRFAIQGKAIPFTDEDIIPLGIVIPQNDIYKIAINQADGLFEDETQDIYLEDTYINTIHNLRTSPYSFTSEIGTFDDRFVLRYNNEALNINEFENNSDLIIYIEDKLVKLKSEINTIESIIVYNVLGQTLIKVDNIDSLAHTLYNLRPSEGVLFVKATLSNGRIKIQKIIY